MQPQTHNFTATYQEGVISAVDSASHKVRCTIPALDDLETAWLPFLTANAGGNQFYCLPDVGEQVALLLDARGEGGCVLGTMFNAQDPTPTSNGEMFMLKFKNGTEISHNRSSGDVIINTKGKVTVIASQTEINAPTTINGDVKVNGNINASGTISAPTVTASDVSLSTHTHTGDSGGKTSPPS